MRRAPPGTTLFPYTTLFRSRDARGPAERSGPQPGRPARARWQGPSARRPIVRDPPRGVKGRWRGATEEFLKFSTEPGLDRKSTRLNSSHSQISYAVFSLKKELILILNSFLGSSDSLVFSELFHSLAPRPLAARSISDFLLTYLAT